MYIERIPRVYFKRFTIPLFILLFMFLKPLSVSLLDFVITLDILPKNFESAEVKPDSLLVTVPAIFAILKSLFSCSLVSGAVAEGVAVALCLAWTLRSIASVF